MGQPCPVSFRAGFDDLRVFDGDIKRILPCLNVPGILYCPEEATPEMLAALEEERDRMTQRIQFLARNRDAIASYLDVARTTGLPGRTTASEPQTTPRPTGA